MRQWKITVNTPKNEHFNRKSQRIGQLRIDKKFSELTVLQNSKKGFQITSHYKVNMELHGKNFSDEEKTPMCCIKQQENRLYSIPS